tara:strand:- start:86 stop:814 length:729 start_codon:yes stop_codon:yes gene_type:complete
MNKVYYVVAKHDKKIFDSYIKPYIRPHNSIVVENSPDLNSMTKKYNEGRRQLLKRLKPDDIVVFVHEDVKIIDPLFEGKLLMAFQRNKKLGVAGVYGTQAYVGGGWWSFERPTFSCGRIIQGLPDGRELEMQDNPSAYNPSMVTLDGCILSIRGSLLKQQAFDQTLIGWHQYDNSYCLQTLYETDYTLAVLDTLIVHQSGGETDEAWLTQGRILLKKYEDMGLEVPITIKSFKDLKNAKLNK